MNASYLELLKYVAIPIITFVGGIIVTISLHFHKLRVERKRAGQQNLLTNELLKSLHKATLISEYYQAEMLDRAALHLELSSDNQLTGSISVLFQEPWESEAAKKRQERKYPANPTILTIVASHVNNATLCLTYKNPGALTNHSGTVMLTTKANEFSGYFMTYHPDVPQSRRTIPGEIAFSYGKAKFTLSTPKLADRFLKHVISANDASIHDS